MSNIRVTCPACNRALKVGAEFEGKEVECGECLQVFVAEVGRAKKPPIAVPLKHRRRRRDEDDEHDHNRRREEYDDDDYDDRSPRRRGGSRERPACSRLVYILLALFLGTLGIHNFYAGRTGQGAAQLAITLVSCMLMCVVIGFFTIWLTIIWSIIDIVTVTHDGQGRWME
jgi:TM2 domain-containing membrane protein YozV